MKDEVLREPLSELWRRLEDVKEHPLSLSLKEISPVILIYVEEVVIDE